MSGLSNTERKAILNLRPYFSADPIIFDVGSNKGFWSDALVGNVHQMHLFEPNHNLLTYTKVKYDYLKNVFFNECALWDKPGLVKEFYFFTNENNGLSSLFHYPNWDHLPMQFGKVSTETIDNYCSANGIPYIDFLKIDVEGAEWEVLHGAAKMLDKTKFVQVEYGFHYKNNNRTFAQVIEYMSGYNFAPYTETLEPVTDFVEDYRLENFIFMKQGFTQDWNSEFKKNTEGLKIDFALEIGCFEGLTTCYICDNMLKPGGRIICVDPLTDEYLPGHKDNDMFKGQYERFIRNTSGRPVELIRKKSQEVWAMPGFSDYRFDFIYVDGDHRKEAVYSDGAQGFDVLRVGGVMLFDDYDGYDQGTKDGVDEFLKLYSAWLTVIHKGYQLMIKKNANRF